MEYSESEHGHIDDRIPILVSSLFVVRSYYIREDRAYEFHIDGKDTLKGDFVRLVKELDGYGYHAMLSRADESNDAISARDLILLVIPKVQPTRRFKPWMPVVLFIATVAVVLYDGLLRSEGLAGLVYGPWQMAALYTLSLMGILGIHELGHMLASRVHRIKATWPFFIPGVPGFFVPTFGAVIFSRAPMTNRDVLFDIGVSGPIAGLIVTIVVSFYGAMLSPLIDEAQARAMMANAQLIPLQPSLLMELAFELTGKSVPGYVPVLSPVAFAAWIGFLITFLNLLPAWQLDGGHIARATLGYKWQRRLTFVSVVILAALGYIFMAMFIMFMSARTQDVRPLDDVSPLSRGRRILFMVVIVLAVLCAPIPSWV
ncbi:MAG: site-2 protease family protein [Candidatus Nitrosocaldus sp.]|nr:site-2 protease family protein [Candidatus Nitrosocaldus sp.]MDW8275376.1 site-2 protease family protein [Candidatus Nitrosocaldus sp.]